MLRVLFVLSALLAVVLAFIIRQPVLYGAAAALLIATFVALAMPFFRRKEKEKKAAAQQAEDDLQSLGILEIRPRGAASQLEQPAGENGQADQPSPDGEPSASAEAPEAKSTFGVSPAMATRKKTVAEAQPTDARLKKDILLPYLQSLQAAIDATTVCLLRQEQPQRFQIEGIVSRNSYARSQGAFTTKAQLLPAGKTSKAVHLLRMGEKGVATRNLGYYLEPIAIRQAALMVVPPSPDSGTYVLVADTMEEGGLGTRRQKALLAEFAALLGTILNFRDTSDEEADAEVDVPEVRPRRDIIAEEMRNARSDERDLALALVYLNRAETVAEQSEQVVLDVETQLEERLRQAAKGTPVARIERFGELTFGVFFHGGANEVETWAADFQQDLTEATDALEGGVSIGAAVMQDRHEGPDALRTDATEALQAAYESGACTIIE